MGKGREGGRRGWEGGKALSPLREILQATPIDEEGKRRNREGGKRREGE